MPLPLEKLRVYPNPWISWTLESGPQGFLAHGGARGSGPLRYIGKAKPVLREKRDEADPRGNDTKYRAEEWQGLNADLVSGTPMEFPVGDTFIIDRLVDGSLVAGDERTAKVTGAMWPSLVAARDACILSFEQHYGPGTFAEKFADKPFVPGAKKKSEGGSGSGGSTGESGGKGGKV